MAKSRMILKFELFFFKKKKTEQRVKFDLMDPYKFCRQDIENENLSLRLGGLSGWVMD
jgi:hypothetical protein